MAHPGSSRGGPLQIWHPQGLALLRDFAEQVFESGRSRYTIPEMILLFSTGADFGFTPTQSLRGLWIDDDGLVQMKASTMCAIVRRHPSCEYLYATEATHVQCTYATKRTDQPRGHTYTFTLDDAIRAGLHASEFYQRWPKAMLAARAMTGLCREQYPELVGAVYDPTEILGRRAPVTNWMDPHIQRVNQQQQSTMPPTSSTSTRPSASSPPRHNTRRTSAASWQRSRCQTTSTAPPPNPHDAAFQAAIFGEGPTATNDDEQGDDLVLRNAPANEDQQLDDALGNTGPTYSIEESESQRLAKRVDTLLREACGIGFETRRRIIKALCASKEVDYLEQVDPDELSALVGELERLDDLPSQSELISRRAAWMLDRAGVYPGTNWQKARARLERSVRSVADADRAAEFVSWLGSCIPGYNHVQQMPAALIWKFVNKLALMDDNERLSLIDSKLG